MNSVAITVHLDNAEGSLVSEKRDPNKKIEIAYKAWGRNDRVVPKRQIVRAKDLSKTIEKLRDKGAFDIFTRDA